jgi:hypothetical protein
VPIQGNTWKCESAHNAREPREVGAANPSIGVVCVHEELAGSVREGAVSGDVLAEPARARGQRTMSATYGGEKKEIWMHNECQRHHKCLGRSR